MDNNNFFKSLSKSLIDDVRKIMEAKAHTVPKTGEEKKLAALAEPKDKITHADVLKGRGVTREEVEQVDELSTKTLRSYRAKAKVDAYDAADVDDDRRLRKRSMGSWNAGKKILKRGDDLRAEEIEAVDEVSKDTLRGYMDKASDARGHRNLSTKKVDNRYAGVQKASSKLAKEEVEVLDEATAKIVAHLQKRYGDNIRKSHVMSAANDFGVGYTGLAHAVRKKLGVIRLKEEIDADLEAELKATRVTKKRMEDSQKTRERASGMKEEVEELDEATYFVHTANKAHHVNKKIPTGKKDAMGQALMTSKVVKSFPYGDSQSKQTSSDQHKAAHDHAKKLNAGMKNEEVEQVDENDMWRGGTRARGWSKTKETSTRKDVGRYTSSRRDNPKETGAGGKLAAAALRRSNAWPSLDERQEEADQIDEISKATMGRYINKAKDSIDMTSYRSGIKDGTAISSSTPYKSNNPLEKKLTKRHKGIETAVNKLTKEEAGYLETDLKKRKKNNDQAVKDMKKMGSPMKNPHFGEEAEVIDELSKKTMGSYVKKASGAERPKNVMSPKSVPITTIAAYQGDSETGHFGKRFNQATYDKAERLRKNRETGIKRAVDKLTKEEIEMIEAKLAGVAPGSMEGDAHMCATKVFHKEWNEGTPIKTMHADPDADGLIEWYDVMFDHGIERVMTEDMEILQAESHMHSKKKMKEGYVPTSDEPTEANKKTAAKVRAMMAKEKMKEEVEQVDELSKNTMLRYVSANKKERKAAEDKGDYGKSVQRMRGTDLAVRKYTATDNKYVRVPATEETKLDEAKRGRPAKNAPVGQEEEPAALGYQLRKATSINRPVHFMNGERKEVSSNHVERFNDHMAARKSSQEKAAFQTRAHKSHAEFVKAVTEPFPKMSKDTGEIVRYRH